jgi:hypothetical protein
MTNIVTCFEMHVYEVAITAQPVWDLLVTGLLLDMSTLTDTDFLDANILLAVTDRIESGRAEAGVSFAVHP